MWVAEAIDVPGDGTCMFHAIGKQVRFNGHALRKVVTDFIRKFPDFKLHDQPICDWIRWDVGITPEIYSKRLEKGQWGGALEFTILSSFLRMPIFVYEPKPGGKCSLIAESRPDFTFPQLKCDVDLKSLSLLFVRKSHYMILRLKRK